MTTFFCRETQFLKIFSFYTWTEYINKTAGIRYYFGPMDFDNFGEPWVSGLQGGLDSINADQATRVNK